MSIWAIADLHLAFSDPSKDMAVFGPTWEDYAQRIEEHWRERVTDDDLVLLAGDTSWAMKAEATAADFEWIDALPGTKLLTRGNHDYWWSSKSKVDKVLPPSMHAIQHTAFEWEETSISGTRLWDSPEYSFQNYIRYVENPRARAPEPGEPDQKIFERELGRLELACQALRLDAEHRVIMVHYPPISADLQPSRASEILERYNVNICVFGHLHNLDPDAALFGERNNVRYVLTSSDYLDFKPIHIL